MKVTREVINRPMSEMDVGLFLILVTDVTR